MSNYAGINYLLDRRLNMLISLIHQVLKEKRYVNNNKVNIKWGKYRYKDTDLNLKVNFLDTDTDVIFKNLKTLLSEDTNDMRVKTVKGLFTLAEEIIEKLEKDKVIYLIEV